MDKLIELLNEYEGDTDNPTWTLNGANEPLYGGWTAYASAYIIPSKKYGFIQRLIDNNKIDLDELNCQRRPFYSYIDEEGYVSFKHFGFYEQLLMLLSIQDEPIEFLISILK